MLFSEDLLGVEDGNHAGNVETLVHDRKMHCNLLDTIPHSASRSLRDSLRRKDWRNLEFHFHQLHRTERGDEIRLVETFVFQSENEKTGSHPTMGTNLNTISAPQGLLAGVALVGTRCLRYVLAESRAPGGDDQFTYRVKSRV